MPKNKYCYAIVNKENGKLLNSTFYMMPIYKDKKTAKDVCRNFTGFVIQPILLEDLERFVINPDSVNYTNPFNLYK